MMESVVGIFHPKSQFGKSWTQNIGGPQYIKMPSNIAKLVTIVSVRGT
jgi:hypothetical protein